MLDTLPRPLPPSNPFVRLLFLFSQKKKKSERLSLSGSKGKRLNETQNINLSLSSLGDVLACLSRNATIIARRSAGAAGGETVAPVPYRNSKLTHFLKVVRGSTVGGGGWTGGAYRRLQFSVQYPIDTCIRLVGCFVCQFTGLMFTDPPRLWPW